MKAKGFHELFFSRTREYLDSYLALQCSRSPHTVKAYRDALTIFRRYVTSQGLSLKTFGFDNCTRDFLLGFLEYLQQCGYEKSSCNQRLAAIKSYMWYVADGDITWQQNALMISRVPFLKTADKERVTLSEECLKALFSAPGMDKRGVRDATIMILLYDSAIRVSELLSLDVSSINFSASPIYIRIHGKGDKERVVTITEKTASHLQAYLKVYHADGKKDMPLFYTVIKGRTDRMSPGNVGRIINKYASAIRPEHPDLPDTIYPHMFRRTRACNLYQDGVELELVSRILGHSSTQTTRIYATPSVEMMRKAMEHNNSAFPDEKPLWEDDESELARLCGIR